MIGQSRNGIVLMLVQLIACGISTSWMQNRCTQISSITGKIENVDGMTDEVIISTVISTTIALGETLCFKLNKVTDPSRLNLDVLNQTSIIYSLKLNDVKQMQNIRNRYEFVIPKAIENKCFCDCPCFADWDLDEKDYCSGSREPCIQILKRHSTDNGCSGSFICADKTSTTLCSYSVERDRSFPVHDAIEISTADTWLYLEFSVLDPESGNVIVNPISIAYNLGQRNNIDISGRVDGKLSISNSPMMSIIPPGWYFKSISTTSALYTGVPVNSFNEWSFEKLGWLRWKYGKVVFLSIKKQELKRKFDYHYTNCEDEIHDWNFYGRFTSREFSKSTKSSVIERYSELQSIRVSDRKVESRLRQSQRFTTKIDLKEKADNVFYFDNSKFKDFTARLQMDTFTNTNTYINISLVEAAGSIAGKFLYGTSILVYQFSLYVDSVSGKNVIIYQALPSHVICIPNFNRYKVCLKTRKKPFVCKDAYPTCKRIQDFEIKNSDPEKVTKSDGPVPTVPTTKPTTTKPTTSTNTRPAVQTSNNAFSDGPVPTVPTSKPTTSTNTTPAVQTSNNASSVTWVVALFGLFVFVMIIILIIVLVCCMCKRKQHDKKGNVNAETESLSEEIIDSTRIAGCPSSPQPPPDLLIGSDDTRIKQVTDNNKSNDVPLQTLNELNSVHRPESEEAMDKESVKQRIKMFESTQGYIPIIDTKKEASTSKPILLDRNIDNKDDSKSSTRKPSSSNNNNKEVYQLLLNKNKPEDLEYYTELL